MKEYPILSNIKQYRITQALVDWYVERMNFITKRLMSYESYIQALPIYKRIDNWQELQYTFDNNLAIKNISLFEQKK